MAICSSTARIGPDLALGAARIAAQPPRARIASRAYRWGSLQSVRAPRTYDPWKSQRFSHDDRTHRLTALHSEMAHVARNRSSCSSTAMDRACRRALSATEWYLFADSRVSRAFCRCSARRLKLKSRSIRVYFRHVRMIRTHEAKCVAPSAIIACRNAHFPNGASLEGNRNKGANHTN